MIQQHLCLCYRRQNYIASVNDLASCIFKRKNSDSVLHTLVLKSPLAANDRSPVNTAISLSLVGIMILSAVIMYLTRFLCKTVIS